MKKSRKEDPWFLAIEKLILFILMSPYHLVKGILFLFRRAKKEIEIEQTQKEREAMSPVYTKFKVIKKEEGDYKQWEEESYSSESKIGIILGARGKGKTALGIKILENAYTKYKRKCYALGFDEKEMPSWINVVSDISLLENGSLVLIDEGGILFSSRNSMTSANKLLSQLILISRHKNLSILFISQNSSNLEVNILRQADFLALKSSSLLQKNFERKIVEKIYNDVESDFKKYSKIEGLTYIYSESFRGFISNPLPSFWKTSISKSFR